MSFEHNDIVTKNVMDAAINGGGGGGSIFEDFEAFTLNADFSGDTWQAGNGDRYISHSEQITYAIPEYTQYDYACTGGSLSINGTTIALPDYWEASSGVYITTGLPADIEYVAFSIGNYDYDTQKLSLRFDVGTTKGEGSEPTLTGTSVSTKLYGLNKKAGVVLHS